MCMPPLAMPRPPRARPHRPPTARPCSPNSPPPRPPHHCRRPLPAVARAASATTIAATILNPDHATADQLEPLRRVLHHHTSKPFAPCTLRNLEPGIVPHLCVVWLARAVNSRVFPVQSQRLAGSKLRGGSVDSCVGSLSSSTIDSRGSRWPSWFAGGSLYSTNRMNRMSRPNWWKARSA